MPVGHPKPKNQSITKNAECPSTSTSNAPTPLTSLNQLKSGITSTPGIVKNANEAHTHLEACYTDEDRPQEPHYKVVALPYGDPEPKSSVDAKPLKARRGPMSFKH
jgi:hypothetical protein